MQRNHLIATADFNKPQQTAAEFSNLHQLPRRHAWCKASTMAASCSRLMCDMQQRSPVDAAQSQQTTAGFSNLHQLPRRHSMQGQYHGSISQKADVCHAAAITSSCNATTTPRTPQTAESSKSQQTTADFGNFHQLPRRRSMQGQERWQHLAQGGCVAHSSNDQ